jgi:DNA-binding CsgD family transcriptional regulator
MARVDGASFRVGEEEFAYLAVGASGPALPELTPAEREVVALVCRGCGNKEIAALRGTSVNTVGNQLSSVFHKLGVASRFELVELATRRATASR